MEMVKIGEHQLPVVPQRHARLRRKLKTEDFANMMGGNYSHESYRVLSILIPELPRKISEHEWDGFAQRDEWQHWKDTDEDPREEDRADVEDDLAPTTAEIVDAFETAFRVSGGGRLGKIVDLIITTQKMGQDRQASVSQTQSSPDSPGGNGEST